MMLTLNDGRTELWQWDTGRTLSVDADCSQVHFSNKVFGRSIDVDVVSGVAIIPDVLLQVDKELTAWAFVGPAADGYTKISKTFKVNRRNKPSDYVFTPVEQTTISEIKAIAQSVRDDADAGKFNGKDGVDGYTPVRGKDYWTDADKQEIVDDALERIDVPDVSVELPVFDLAALSMSAVTLPAGVSSVSTDTTELQSALSKGDVIFVIPVNMGGTTIPVHAIMQGIALGTSYQCMTLFVLDGASALVINVEPGSVTVMVMPAATAVGFPEVTTEDNGKFLQVVDGSWAAVVLQDVSEVGE